MEHMAKIKMSHLLILLLKNSIAGLNRSITKKITNIMPMIMLVCAKNPQKRCLFIEIEPPEIH